MPKEIVKVVPKPKFLFKGTAVARYEAGTDILTDFLESLLDNNHPNFKSPIGFCGIQEVRSKAIVMAAAIKLRQTGTVLDTDKSFAEKGESFRKEYDISPIRKMCEDYAKLPEWQRD